MNPSTAPLTSNYERDTVNYKAASGQQNPQGNIIWDVQLFCGAKLDPDIRFNALQHFQCQ